MKTFAVAKSTAKIDNGHLTEIILLSVTPGVTLFCLGQNKDETAVHS